MSKMKFSEILELMKYIVNLNEGSEAYESFYRSLVADFVNAGYEEERAVQVIDEMIDNFLNKYGR